MKKLVLLLLLLPLSQAALARVYMCVDPQTGKTSFTDRACEKTAAREEVRVDDAPAAGPKVWNSHRDMRKDGRDYNDERRSLYENKASAGAENPKLDS
jgi:uncharacterized protein (DUF488 family)